MSTHTARVMRVVVASPGDVQPERDALSAVLEELNRGVAADRNVVLRLLRWETDAYPGFHAEGPQGSIDDVLDIENCDVLIGIFWKRFGTPVKDAASGTEHEIRRAYEGWKRNGRPQIMVYFNQKSYSPSTKSETDQWGQVLSFKANFPKEGLWWPYKGKQDFVNLVRNHLTQWLRREARPSAAGGPGGDAGTRDAGGGAAEGEPREPEKGGGGGDSKKPPTPGASFKDMKRGTLRGQMESLLSDYEAANRQLEGMPDGVDRNRLKRQIKNLESEIETLEQEIDRLK